MSNQGGVTSSELPTISTNDPTTQAIDDATVTAVTAAAALGADQAVTLANDADNNGFPSPGDTLLYLVTLASSGNSAASGVAFNDALDANTTLGLGSLQTSQGMITVGAGGAVQVGLGTIPGGASATISFRAVIKTLCRAASSVSVTKG